jgi:hypothetical protein
MEMPEMPKMELPSWVCLYPGNLVPVCDFLCHSCFAAAGDDALHILAQMGGKPADGAEGDGAAPQFPNLEMPKMEMPSWVNPCPAQLRTYRNLSRAIYFCDFSLTPHAVRLNICLSRMPHNRCN